MTQACEGQLHLIKSNMTMYNSIILNFLFLGFTVFISFQLDFSDSIAYCDI